MEIIHEITMKIVDLDLDGTLKSCQVALDQHIKPAAIIEGSISKAVDEIGNLFEKGEFFIPELIFAGEILSQVIKMIDAVLMSGEKKKSLGTVLVGTGKGDLHDIGKNIFTLFLSAEGFEVIDLGVDVTADKFITAIQEHQPNILAISTLLTSTMLELISTMKTLEQAGVRDMVKIILGGAPMTQAFVDQVGADAYGKNAIEGVRICKRWIEE